MVAYRFISWDLFVLACAPPNRNGNGGGGPSLGCGPRRKSTMKHAKAR